MTQHPISPPPELVEKWNNLPLSTQEIIAIAWRNGADTELEACCEWFVRDRTDVETADKLRAARRPKPLSLKEQALEALMTADGPDHPTPMLYLRPDAASIIRRALESIPDPS